MNLFGTILDETIGKVKDENTTKALDAIRSAIEVDDEFVLKLVKEYTKDKSNDPVKTIIDNAGYGTMMVSIDDLTTKLTKNIKVINSDIIVSVKSSDFHERIMERVRYIAYTLGFTTSYSGEVGDLTSEIVAADCLFYLNSNKEIEAFMIKCALVKDGFLRGFFYTPVLPVNLFVENVVDTRSIGISETISNEIKEIEDSNMKSDFITKSLFKVYNNEVKDEKLLQYHNVLREYIV